MMRSLWALSPALAIFFAASAARADVLSVSTNLHPSHWGVTQGIQPYMACVTNRTAGALRFEFYHSGSIAATHEALNAINGGLVDIAYVVMVAETARMPLNGIPMLPGLSASVLDLTKANRASISKDGKLAAEYSDNQIVPLMVNMFPAYQIAGRSQSFESLASLRNAKISAGGGSLVVTLDAVAASPVEMNAGDLYVAIQQGTLDGSMLALASVESYKLYEVLSSVSTNGMFGSATGTWSIGLQKWQKLPHEHQQALVDCGREAEITLANWVDAWTDDLAKSLAENGLKTFEYSSDEIALIDTKLAEARDVYIRRLDERGLPASTAMSEFADALAGMRTSAELSE